jgi:hypothetical protein
MEGRIFRREAYIRNGLSVSKYGGLIHRGLVLVGGYIRRFTVYYYQTFHIYIYIYMNVVVSHVYDSTRVMLCSGF